MAETPRTPINLAPTITDDIGNFYVTEDGGLGLAQVAKSKIATSDGATDGDMFYVSGGDVVRLPAPTDNQVLIGSASLPVWGEAFAFKRISQSTITSAVSSVVFSNLPSTGYSEFILTLDGFVTALAGTSDALSIHVSTDNGSTWKTTSGDYVSHSGSNTTSLTGTGILCPGGTATSPAQAAVCRMIGLGNATRVTALTFTSSRSISGTVSMMIPITTTSFYRNAREQDNAFRIISANAANLTAGKATLYGIVE